MPRRPRTATAPAQASLFTTEPTSASRATPPTRVRVFAYGSNLDEDQMRARCPSSRLLGVATLGDHVLAFAGYSVSRKSPVATVLACPGLAVPGALYTVTPDDLTALDACEGVPWMYARDTTSVQASSGGTRRAAIYRLQPAQLGLGFGTPTLEYLRLIQAAYQRLALPRDALEIAVEVSRRSAARYARSADPAGGRPRPTTPRKKG